MRTGFFAMAIMLGSFSPPPCQKTNPAFEAEDAGGSESGQEGSSTSGSSTSDAASGMSESTGGGVSETTAVTDASSAATDDGADGETTGSAESTTDGPCPDPGHELCSASCVDTTSNRDHCGMCDHKCHPVMQNCENSMCVPV